MNAIELLEKQHEETLTLLTKLERSTVGSERKGDFKELHSALLAHMVIEEELFYPAVAGHAPEGEPIAEGYEEHAGARAALERCQRAVADEELFQIRVMVLREMITHHIREERGEIFPLAKQTIPPDYLVALGEEMAARFDEAKTERPAAKLDRLATLRTRHALGR